MGGSTNGSQATLTKKLKLYMLARKLEVGKSVGPIFFGKENTIGKNVGPNLSFVDPKQRSKKS